MATHIKDQKELKAIQVTPYKNFRPKLKSGDLLFTSGRYFVSKAIQHFTNSPWSHVGIILHVKAIDRVLLLESVEDMGVRFAPLSKYVLDYEHGKPYRGILVVARPSGVTREIVTKLAQHGTDELTRPYDKDEIVKIFTRIVLGIGKKERDREYICSELVYECFANAGYKFTYDPKGFISPENIWVDKRVKLLARIQ